MKKMPVLRAAILTCALVGVVYFVQEWLLRTDFTPGYSEEKFSSVTMGYHPKDVLKVLGEPFSVTVHHLRMAENDDYIVDGSSNPLEMVGSKPFVHFAEDVKYEVVLNYSKAFPERDIYRARQVVFRNGRVAEVSAYNIWGD